MSNRIYGTNEIYGTIHNFNGEFFNTVGSTDIRKEKIQRDIKVLPVKCECCGASLMWMDGIIKCGFCGTEYTKEK